MVIEKSCKKGINKKCSLARNEFRRKVVLQDMNLEGK